MLISNNALGGNLIALSSANHHSEQPSVNYISRLRQKYSGFSFQWTLIFYRYSTGYFTGQSGLCNSLSLHYFVPWINHLPPVCWSNFWKSDFNESCFISLISWKRPFHCFWFFLCTCNCICLIIKLNHGLCLPYCHVLNSALVLLSTTLLNFP